MAYSSIVHDCAQGIARITLNRPHRLNAYTPAMVRELVDAVDLMRRDEAARVLVVTGAGRAFCAGGDVNAEELARSPFSGHPMAHLLEMREHFHQLVLSLRRLDKPVIAAVNGPAVAGGLTLALCCDFRVAAESARLGDTAVGLGLLPDEGGAYLFPRAMGVGAALRMTLLSEVYDARRALELGLVTEVVPDAELMPAVERLARRLAEGAPLAIRLAKRMIYKQLEMTLENALEDAALAVQITNPSEDAREGIAAFMEKRKPRFTGR